jgi:hypothetical protein
MTATPDYDRAKSALWHQSATCSRVEWVKYGMGAADGGLSFDDWHEWSKTGDNYKSEADCRSAWKSFKNSGAGGVTVASLFQAALAQGWQDPAKRQQAANGNRVGAPIAAPKKAPVSQIKQVGGGDPLHTWELGEPPTAAHPYIAKKGGIADGLRVYPRTAPVLTICGKNVADYLMVPCWSDDKLQTLQFIPGDGDKLNLPGASFNDGFFIVGDIATSGRMYIVEGIGQAWACHAATDAAAVVCFGAGRMATVAASLRAQYPAARLVVVPDRAKENQAQAIATAVNCEWCELPADKPGNYDANDYALEFGTDALADLLNRSKAPPMRFKLLSGADLSSAPPLRWMVRGVLPLEGLAALYGPSGSGKSFLILDISASVAGGEYVWFGRRVTQCPVTYCALEGEAGMGKRVNAWTLHRKKPVEAHEAAMVDAVGSGEKLPKNNAPDLHAEAAAIDQAHATFPARLAEHRARGTVKDGGVHAARGVLHQAQFDHAIFVYRAAMEPIWPLVDQVRQLSTPRHDMTGMADSNGRFGKLPGQ